MTSCAALLTPFTPPDRFALTWLPLWASRAFRPHRQRRAYARLKQAGDATLNLHPAAMVTQICLSPARCGEFRSIAVEVEGGQPRASEICAARQGPSAEYLFAAALSRVVFGETFDRWVVGEGFLRQTRLRVTHYDAQVAGVGGAPGETLRFDDGALALEHGAWPWAPEPPGAHASAWPRRSGASAASSSTPAQPRSHE